MKQGYRKLGDFIRQVDVRNKDLSINKLLGVSITKAFIPSIANTIGTDFSNYKIVHKGQFAYGPVTSRNGEKISIALLQEDDCIISSSYSVFEIINNELIADYLMLWFMRPEFDRYARYKSHGSVREVCDWEELCSVELPVPNIEKQLEIVNSYNAIENRIALKRKINDNLLSIGISIIQKHCGTCALINYSEAEIENIILKDGFSIKSISDFCIDTKSGSTPSRSNDEYWRNGTIPWVKSGEVHNNITLQTEECITPVGLNGSSTKLLPPDTVLMAMYGVTAGEVGYLAIEATTNQAICGMICATKSESAYLFFTLLQSQSNISRLSNGGAQDNLSKNFIDSIKLLVPPSKELENMNLSSIIEQMRLNYQEMIVLEKIQTTVLALLSSN